MRVFFSKKTNSFKKKWKGNIRFDQYMIFDLTFDLWKVDSEHGI